MEKFSAFRDPGTGIQPFLTPVPPVEANTVASLLLPVSYLIAFIRTVLVLVVALLYGLLVHGLCLVFLPAPILHRAVTYVLTALLSRVALLVLGLWWIPVELVHRKRGRPGTVIKESWSPIAGDVIVSNWVSWAEILWLAFRFNPIYVMPVTEPQTSATTQSSSPISRTPGRRTGTGSAAVAPAHRSSTPRAQVLGFCRVSLLFILRHTGQGPLLSTKSGYTSLEEIRRGADRPLVIFPECTTSNGRALLRFADIFLEKSVPSKNYNVLVMCIRYDPPTSLAPTLTLSIPTKFNPLAHIFAVASGLKPLTASIRLLAPSEGPSAPTFLASEVISGDVGEDTLSAACAGLIAQLGKFKKVNFGWEDKVAFLDLYRQKSTR